MKMFIEDCMSLLGEGKVLFWNCYYRGCKALVYGGGRYFPTYPTSYLPKSLNQTITPTKPSTSPQKRNQQMLTLIKDLGTITPPTKPNSKNKYKYCLYKCNCGNTTKLRKHAVNRGEYKHCEKCEQKYIESKIGKKPSRLKRIWFYMMERCYNKNHYTYKYYGAKGVKVYKKWHTFKHFKHWALSNGYKKDLTLDKDFMAWALNTKPEYSPRGCIFIKPEKNQQLKRLLNL